ncbi:MAG: hypothetical protein BGO12_08715 [Verrucomicrobia bacterium 61-8]|nr:LON peptidase substrate-binding domain-containing protein [Verrucomicrobiota bacterium]OJV10131.1 MAG: hypothetical protein BGO12_08715 [Verrucomicrobia bacterium 61-8]
MKLETNLPEVLGVMVLPGVLLFPGSLVPLYIFEQRYRRMLADALATQRIFGIVPRSEMDRRDSDLAGVGLIRACVGNEDGTSHLVLLGLYRVCIVDWLQDTDYPTVRVKALENQPPPSGDAAPLRRKITRLCRSLAKKGRELPPHFENVMAATPEPSEFSDLVAGSLVDDPSVREYLFYELDASRRLKTLADYLSAKNL